MKKRHRGGNYRPIRTRQELRANQDCPYARSKRKKGYLPDAWDDQIVPMNNCWKNKRLTQYRDKPRGKKRIFKVPANYWFRRWEWEAFAIKHDIPYDIPDNWRKWLNDGWVIVYWHDKELDFSDWMELH